MKLIIISWRANSWKTSLRKYISKELWLKSISSSDYTKTLTNDLSRLNLEKIFNDIVNIKWFDYLSKEIINFWFKSEKYWLIDWIRHKKLIDWFKKLLLSENIYHIHINLSEKNRYFLSKKSNRIEWQNLILFKKFEKESTHENNTETLKYFANEIIWDEYIYFKEKVEKKVLIKLKKWIYSTI